MAYESFDDSTEGREPPMQHDELAAAPLISTHHGHVLSRRDVGARLKLGDVINAEDSLDGLSGRLKA